MTRSLGRYFRPRRWSLLALWWSLWVICAPVAAEPLRVGAVRYFPPHYELNPLDGTPTGFAIELFDALAQQLQLDYRYVLFEGWAEAQAALRTGSIDVIPVLGLSAERQSYALFTRIIEEAPVRLFVRSNESVISGPSDFPGHRIAVVTANTSAQLATELNAEPVIYGSLQDAVLALLSGRVEALLFSQYSVETLLSQSGLSDRIKAVGEPVYILERALAVRPGLEDLRDSLDAALEPFLRSTQYQEINRRWYGKPTPWLTARQMTFLIVALLIVSAALCLWRYRSVVQLERRMSELKARQREALLEAQSTEMAAKLRVFFDQSLTFAGILDLDGTVADVNSAALAASGTAREAVLGHKFWQTPWWGHSVEAQHVVADAVAAAADGGVYRTEINYTPNTGEVRSMDLTLSPVRNDAGTIIFLAAAGLDITERKLALQEVERARLAAEQANTAKSAFLANMSHELRTPLSAILGYTDILARHRQGADDQLAIEAIHRNGNHLLALLNDILDLSKIEAGKLNVRLEKVATTDLVDEIYTLVESRARARGIEFNVSYDGAVPAHINTDPVRARQILVNLLSNAIKFTEQGRVDLEIRCDCVDLDNACLQFVVRDTGIGIAPERLQKIFEVFEQGDSSTTRRFEGSGLGLSISRQLAALLNSEIQVASELGHGSEFTLNLSAGTVAAEDLIQPAGPRLVAGRPEADLPALNGRRILVVDDRADMRLLVERMVERAGGSPVSAANGAEALTRVAEDGPFHAIIIDMQMPVMDGFEATRQLRAKQFRNTIIALTAGAMLGEREKCIEAGCDYYLTKPVRQEQLLQLLAEPARQPTAPPERQILLVEDNADAADATAQLLRLEGYDVSIAHTGGDALNTAAQRCFAAVLLDLTLPDLPGSAVAEQLRGSGHQALLIGLSGAEPDAATLELFDCYLRKPVALTELIAALSGEESHELNRATPAPPLELARQH